MFLDNSDILQGTHTEINPRSVKHKLYNTLVKIAKWFDLLNKLFLISETVNILIKSIVISVKAIHYTCKSNYKF